MTQIITIKPDGSVVGLKHGKGRGVDLRKLGAVQISRVTLIEWDEQRQKWGIRWNGRLQNAVWTRDHLRTVCHLEVPVWPPGQDRWNLVPCGVMGIVGAVVADDLGGSPIYFDEYETAVQAEVAVIQHFQRQPHQQAL